MGGTASKELDATVLGECNALHEGGADAIFDGAVTKTAMEEVKGKGSSYMDSDGKKLVTFKTKGLMKKHTIIMVDDKIVAYAITAKKGMTSATTFILREKPTYDGQEHTENEDLAKAGLKLENDTKLYGFAKVEMSKPSMTTAKSIYSIATGKDEFKELYIAEKLSAMNFFCIVKTASGGVPILKACMKGITTNVTVQVSAGVDFVAAVLAGQSTFSPDGTVGALAGAGVV